MNANQCKTKVCSRCKEEYWSTNNAQKYCPECAIAIGKERRREYYEENREIVIARSKTWGIEHPDKVIESRIKHNVEHRDDVRKANRKWASTHPEHVSEYHKQWREENPEKVRESRNKNRAQRSILGFTPLNSIFPNCDAHHINLNDIIYIPHKMHMSIRHNVFTGKNMTQINLLAGAYLTEGWT